MRVLVIDGQHFFADKIQLLLKGYDPSIETCYSGNIFSAYQHIMSDTSIDLILLDINENYPKNSIELIQIINKLRVYIPIIIVSTNDSIEAATLAIENKLSGYIAKSYSNELTLDSINSVLEEGMFSHKPKPVTLNESKKDNKGEVVSFQQLVMDLFRKGLMNTQIADELNISSNIVNSHVHDYLSSIQINLQSEEEIFELDQQLFTGSLI